MIKLNFLARYGTIITFILLVCIGMLTWFVKYPETIQTQAILTGINTPKAIVPHVSGKIIKLFKKNNDTVATGDLIGCMESVASWKEVLQLSEIMDSMYLQIEAGNAANVASLMEKNYSYLGEIQSSYQAFRQAYLNYYTVALSGYAQKKKSLLKKDDLLIVKTKKIISAQSNLQEKDLWINQQYLEKNKKLLERNIISQEEYDRLISENISKKMTVPQTQLSIINIESQKNSVSKEILEINNQTIIQKALFQEALFNFKNVIDEWKNKYLLIASTSGVLSFTEFIQENQQLQQGNTIAYINPSNTIYYLKSTIPQHNFGKVENGQRVILRFHAYQWQEYGTVSGKVGYVSPNASDSGYIASIVLPEGLKTNYNKRIAFHDGLKADAEIVTKDLRLTQQFYYGVIKQIRK